MPRLALALLITSLAAHTSAGNQAPLFADDTPIEATLTLPLGDIYYEAKQDKQKYKAGNIIYQSDNGEQVELPVKAKARGVSRRLRCLRPPLRLNFKKSDLGGTVFDGQNKLKLVNPCSTGKSGERHLALEYLAYRVYEVLSDNSFDTRLLQLRYVDSNERVKGWKTTAFVIEEEKRLMERLGGETLGDDAVSFDTVDPFEATRVELFQYLISNADFSLYSGAPGDSCCHNMKYLVAGTPNAPRYVPVPYDFDNSGLVNAPYAKHPAPVPTANVRLRYFMGYCRDPMYLDEVVAQFLSRKQDVLKVLDSELLDRETREKTLQYVEEFFAILNSPEKSEDRIYKRCRKLPT